jgi:hypothetical protein
MGLYFHAKNKKAITAYREYQVSLLNAFFNV